MKSSTVTTQIKEIICKTFKTDNYLTELTQIFHLCYRTFKSIQVENINSSGTVFIAAIFQIAFGDYESNFISTPLGPPSNNTDFLCLHLMLFVVISASFS